MKELHCLYKVNIKAALEYSEDYTDFMKVRLYKQAAMLDETLDLADEIATRRFSADFILV
jgi:hypothetical protein